MLSVYGSTHGRKVYILGTREGLTALKQLLAQATLAGNATKDIGRLEGEGTAKVTIYSVDLDRLREIEQLVEDLTGEEGDGEDL